MLMEKKQYSTMLTNFGEQWMNCGFNLHTREDGSIQWKIMNDRSLIVA